MEQNKIDLFDIAKNKFLIIHEGESDQLNQVQWHLNNLPKTRNMILGKRKNYFPFISSRGCPYSCREYCTYPTSQGRKVRRQSNENTIEKLNNIAKKFPNSHIIFRDPVFSINIKATKDLLTKISSANLS